MWLVRESAKGEKQPTPKRKSNKKKGNIYKKTQ